MGDRLGIPGAVSLFKMVFIGGALFHNVKKFKYSITLSLCFLFFFLLGQYFIFSHASVRETAALRTSPSDFFSGHGRRVWSQFDGWLTSLLCSPQDLWSILYGLIMSQGSQDAYNRRWAVVNRVKESLWKARNSRV